MNRRNLISLILLGFVGVASFGLLLPQGHKTEQGTVKVVRVGTFNTAIDYAPYIIAKKKGWLDDALKSNGFVVEHLPTFQSLPSANEAMAAGRLDIVLTGEIPTLIGRAAGIDVKIAWVSCRLQADTVVPINSTAQSIRDLKGKKVAVLAGSAPYYWVTRNLAQNGMAKNDVTYLDMPPAEAKAAFEIGAIDAWAMFPPWPETLIAAGSARVLPEFKAPIQVVASARGKFASENPRALGAFLSSLDKAKAWLIQNPADAQKLISDELGLALPIVSLSWPKLDWTAKFDLKQSQETALFLKEEGFVKNVVNIQDLLLPEVIKN